MLCTQPDGQAVDRLRDEAGTESVGVLSGLSLEISAGGAGCGETRMRRAGREQGKGASAVPGASMVSNEPAAPVGWENIAEVVFGSGAGIEFKPAVGHEICSSRAGGS